MLKEYSLRVLYSHYFTLNHLLVSVRKINVNKITKKNIGKLYQAQERIFLQMTLLNKITSDLYLIPYCHFSIFKG